MPLRQRTATAFAVLAMALAGCGSSPSVPSANQAGKQSSAGAHHPKSHAAKSPGAQWQGSKRGHNAKHSGLPATTHQQSSPSPGTSSSTRHRPAGSGSKPHSRPSTRSRGPAPIAPGAYTHKQSGSQDLSGFHSSLAPTSTLVVHRAKANGRQTSRINTGGKQPPSDQTMLFNAKGMFLLSEVQRVALPGRTETIRCTFHPGVPYPPWPVAVGQKVHAHTDCGQVRVSAKGKVVGRRTAVIGGQSLSVFVIDTTLTTSGQVDSTSTDTEWFSPALPLSVHDAGKTSGKFGPFGFSGTFTRTLSSTTPS